MGGAVPRGSVTKLRLRDAGAIIIAKTGMTELANFIAGPPTPMAGNYNGLAGYGNARRGGSVVCSLT